jgi:ABC-type uncharacterized transport system ATPase subunit
VSEETPIVRFESVSKTYANGTIALRDVSFSIRSGVIYAVCGENGAGKSTLMKIMFGMEQPSSGAIHIDGVRVSVDTPRMAAALGIGMVHQHFSLFPSLTVAENILIGQEPRRGPFIDKERARQRVLELSRRYNLPADPDAIVGTLSIAAQQKVEILKALSRDVRILILDEPTAVLTPPETDELFQRLRDLKAAGLTVLFISHKLREVRALAQYVTTLRAGQVSGDANMADISDDAIAKLVMGNMATSEFSRRTPRVSAPHVVLSGLSLAADDPNDRVTGIDLSIGRGEILGIAGVDGSGQRGLVSLLTGGRKPSAGDIFWDGTSVLGLNTARLRSRGLAHLPADRFREGGAKRLSLTENAMAGAHRLEQFSAGPFLKRGAMAARTNEIIAEYNVRCPSAASPLQALSGGNAQKIIAAREFASKPSVLIADQPTRGIDIAAAAFIQERIMALASEGTSVLLLSADLDELLRLSDRVAVLYAGKIVAVLDNTEALTPARLGPFMLGLENAA